MTRKSGEPLQRELYEAFKAGMSLDQYVNVYRLVKNHTTAMVIVTFDTTFINNTVWPYFINNGVNGKDTEDAINKGCDLMEYVYFTRHDELSHGTIIDLILKGVTSTDYALSNPHGISIDEIVCYKNEVGSERTNFYQYAIARKHGFSCENAGNATESWHRLIDDLDRVLLGGVTQEEVVAAIGHIGSLNNGRDYMIDGSIKRYADIRSLHYDGSVAPAITHEQALEVASDWSIYEYRYRANRIEKEMTHEEAMKSSRLRDR